MMPTPHTTDAHAAAHTPRPRLPDAALARVPEVTAAFWAVKLMTTGMGEAASDWMAGVSIPLAVGVGFLGCALALWVQIRRETFSPAVYWTAVSMVAVFGTIAADAVHVALDVPYALTTILYILAVAAVFIVWHRAEGTLSIHSITTRRREIFYWATVLATFALGTAVGDFTAMTLDLGYFPSALLYGALILIPLVGYRVLHWNGVLCFWAAYVLTRPLGASIADWLGKEPNHGGGLGWGDGPVTLALIVLIIAAVALTKQKAARAD